MPATYTPVTQSEMEEILLPQGFQRTSIPGVTEIVYSKSMERNLELRVFSSIDPNGNSRACGEDAIRVRLFGLDTLAVGDPWRPLSGSKRVHRTQGWRKNLQERIDKWAELTPPACPNCGGRMTERYKQGKKSHKFWGCLRFPNCRGTLPITPDDTPKPSVQNPCPSCGKAMILKRNRTTQDEFWGCSGYPDCRVTLPKQK